MKLISYLIRSKMLLPIVYKVLYTSCSFFIILYFNRFRGKPAIPSLIGLSPLTTIHPSILLIHEFGPLHLFIDNST